MQINIVVFVHPQYCQNGTPIVCFFFQFVSVFIVASMGFSIESHTSNINILDSVTFLNTSLAVCICHLFAT